MASSPLEFTLDVDDVDEPVDVLLAGSRPVVHLQLYDQPASRTRYDGFGGAETTGGDLELWFDGDRFTAGVHGDELADLGTVDDIASISRLLAAADMLAASGVPDGGPARLVVDVVVDDRDPVDPVRFRLGRDHLAAVVGVAGVLADVHRRAGRIAAEIDDRIAAARRQHGRDTDVAATVDPDGTVQVRATVTV